MTKKWLKRIVIGGLLLFVGAFIGAVAGGSSSSYIIEEFDGDSRLQERIEERIAIQEEEVVEIVEEIVVRPKIEIPQLSERDIRIEYGGPSLFQLISTAANLLTAVLLIGIGIILLIRRRQAPIEKQPES